MPGLVPKRHAASPFASLVPFLHAGRDSVLSNVTDAFTLPGSPLISLALFAVGCRVLWLRGEPGAAVLWAGAFVVGNVAEIVAKSLVARPALYADSIHLGGFDHSYPSGHMLRSALVAALAWRLAPRAAPYALALAAVSAVMLVVGGWHTPSDVAGALILAGFLVAAAPR